MRPFLVETRRGEPFAWKPGRITVICLCAMWCNTWKDQLPRLSKSQESLKGLPVDYLAISVDGRWLDRAPGSPYANLLSDPDGKWSSSIGIDRVPYTLVIDASGVIRSSAQGILRSDDIVERVRTAMHPVKGGTIYLTFAGINDSVLDVLRSARVPASFFCGSGEKTILERARSEGHFVQSRLPSTSNGAVSIRDGLGTRLFVDDPYDSTRPGEKELIRRVLNQARPGAAVYLHSDVSETRSILMEVIANLRRRGFVFRTLE